MSGQFFFYGIISETLHIRLNAGEDSENVLLQNGLAFVVEEGTETASSLDEV